MFLKILLCFFIILLILLIFPIRMKLTYTDDFSFSVSYLFFTFSIYPSAKEKTESKRAVKKEKKPSEKSEKKKEEKNTPFSSLQKLGAAEGVEGAVDFVKEVSSIVINTTGKLCSHLIVNLIDVRMDVAAQDAAQTAILYGRVCTAVFPVIEALCSVSKVRRYFVEINPDFLANKTKSDMTVIFSVRVMFIISAAFAALFRYIKNIVLKNKKTDKAV